jgi:hypothetical protein
MRTPEQDSKMQMALLDFDRATVDLLKLGISDGHLTTRVRIASNADRGAVICPLTGGSCTRDVDDGHPCDRDQHGNRIEMCDHNLERGRDRYVQLGDVLDALTAARVHHRQIDEIERRFNPNVNRLTGRPIPEDLDDQLDRADLPKRTRSAKPLS